MHPFQALEREELPDLLTTEEAASILAIAPATLKFWRVRGHRAGPDFIKLGGGRGAYVRYSLKDIQRYLRRRTVRVIGVGSEAAMRGTTHCARREEAMMSGSAQAGREQ